jgi:hypothetical protein
MTTESAATSPSSAATSASSVILEAETFLLPLSLRDPAKPDPIASHLEYWSLAELFPEADGLAELFDSDEDFRASIRSAARADLFVPDPRLSAEANGLLSDPGSSLEGNWKQCERCDSLTAVFRAHGFGTLTGSEFIQRLGRLCVDGGRAGARPGAAAAHPTTGSWLDIVSPVGGRLRANHAWHQDSGLAQYTAMLGFPLRDGYCGPGVFSHGVKLSHAMPPPEVPGPVILNDLIPEAYHFKPVYRKGQEVIVYKDCDHVHSAPNEFIRAGIWRFM